MRVLSSEKLPIDLNSGEDSRIPKFSTSCFCLPPRPIAIPKQATNTVDKLIIHIHGGGFVAMSSSSHQNYTRIWANELGIPIFSIDYRLAPKWKFPCALVDCWQVYQWLIERGCQELGLNGGAPPKKVILVGDSAGGNLVAALTCLAIQRNYRIPDGIQLIYPGKKCHFVTLIALNLSKTDL